MKLDPIISMLFTTEQGCRIAKACTGLLAILALVALTTLLTTWWEDMRLVSFSKKTLAARKNVSMVNNDLLSHIPEAHLFGSNLASSSAIPITTSQFRLMGIIKVKADQATNKETAVSSAIVSIDGGIGKVYQEGEVLPGGIKMTTIRSDGVVLDNGGHLERLPLQRPTLERK